jgi:hypothetical protein
MKKAIIGASFAKRHYKALSAVGSLILLVTFVAKDVVRDYLKDYVSDLNALSERYRVGANTRDIETMLSSLDDRIAHIDGKLDSQAINARFDRVVMQNSVAINDISVINEDQINEAIELADTLQDNGRLKGELEK